jgi:hypothetical protein
MNIGVIPKKGHPIIRMPFLVLKLHFHLFFQKHLKKYSNISRRLLDSEKYNL